MATSGSVDLATSRDDLIQFALEKVGLIAIGGTPTSAQYTSGARELNFMVKAWEADGLQMWAKKKGYMFLAADTNVYQLGSSSYDKATNSYVKTQLDGAVAASGTTLTVDSITGISNADIIGIVLSDGTLHWDVVNGAPSGSTVTLTTGLASAASDNAYVFAYTSNITKPLRIMDAFIRDTSDQDRTIEIRSLSEYEDLPDKTTDGPVTQMAVRPDNAYTEVYLWPQPDDVSDVLVFWYHRPFDDFDASSDEPDFPQEWYLALGYGLAEHLGLTYGVPDRIQSKVAARAMYYKDEAMGWDQEQAALYIQPDDEP